MLGTADTDAHRPVTATRDRLLRAAMELLLTRGYADTNIDRICRAAETSYSTFTNHFGRKRHIAHEVADTSPPAQSTASHGPSPATPTTSSPPSPSGPASWRPDPDGYRWNSRSPPSTTPAAPRSATESASSATRSPKCSPPQPASTPPGRGSTST
ncbi:TetR/AcrR family transcriptional regulator [Nocardia amikacinitolerans]|uniref:TetR/AcrR family transcriptional regulator n=1 Tax=Nocardia amikacinitolerans TaxID=756689 RepID=UPI0036A6BE39